MKKIIHYSQIESEEVNVEGAKKIKVRWLISSKDGVENFAMRLFEIEPNGNSPHHSHSYEHEIFILEGSGKVLIEDVEHNISPGYAIYIPPNTRHTIKNTGETTLKFLCMIPITR